MKHNLELLIKKNGELNKKIVKEQAKGNDVSMLMKLRDKVTERIKLISPKVFPGGV